MVTCSQGLVKALIQVWLFQFQVPFSNETRDLVLEKLSDMNFVQDICDDLHALFEVGTHDLYPDPLSILGYLV